MVEILLKKYSKLLRSIFFKYSSTSYTSRNKKDFEGLKQRDHEVTQSEMWKIVKYYKLDK